MITNKYKKNCQSCNKSVGVSEGFAYRNGNAWFTVCNSKACFRKLGLKETEDENIPRKLTEDGLICMPYDRMAVQLIKSLPGAKFFGKEDSNNPMPGFAVWKVSTKPADINRVIDICTQLQLEIPDSLKGSASTEESKAAIVRANTTINGRMLYDFQKIGVDFLALKNRALLADDMGVGKTPTSLVAIPENARVIVCCPASLKYNWKDEANLWRPEYKVIVCNGRESFVLPEKGEIVICNYDILPAYLMPTKDSGQVTRKGKPIMVADLTEEQQSILKEVVLIADEAQALKRYSTIRAQKVTQIAILSRIVWLLTGTPVMTRPLDLFGILCAGNMNPFGTFENFLKLFNGYKNEWGGYEFGMPQEIVPELMRRVMLRRMKSEVLKDLPPKTYQEIEVELTDATKKKLDGYLKKIFKENGEEVKKADNLESKLDVMELPDFTEFSEIRTLLSISRIPAMLEIVESYEESDTPLVVFSDHKKPIEELASRDGWKIITGDTDPLTRRNIVKEFQSGQLKGVGLTIGAGGTGLTLTRASNMLFIDLSWTPAANIQAEDRLVRIGQTGTKVLVMRMSSTHPLDVHIQKLLKYKLELAYRALDASLKFKPLPPKKAAIELVEETDEELMSRIQGAAQDVEREISLGKLQRILGREAAKVNDVPEPELTAARKETLRNALDYMISICDGAETRDSQGFNKPDACIARWVGNCLRDEDEVSYRVLERILVRYRRQLKGKFAEIWKP